MSQYFLAVTPDRDVSRKIENLQKNYCKGIGKSLFPHITILPPFIPTVSEEKLIKLLGNIFKFAKKKRVLLNNVGFFDNEFEGKINNVIFLSPDEPSTEYLGYLNTLACNKTLRKSVDTAYEDYNIDTHFIPHLTLASKIPTEDFLKARQKILGISIILDFQVVSVELYKWYESSRSWEMAEKFVF